jgi:hypothetical protein
MLRALLIISFLGLAACGNGDTKKGDGNESENINWGGVPSEFNPQVENFENKLNRVRRININLFGFQDVRVKYSRELPNDLYRLDVFSVSKDARTSVSGVDTDFDGNILRIRKFGNYECKIETSGKNITSVKGACYVRVVLTLPQGAEIEVYNVDRLISRRFFAMDNRTFIETLKRAWPSDRKMEVIKAYLDSYRQVGKRPSLNCPELDTVLENFSWVEEKYEVLRKLHVYVSDRENLPVVIDNNFNYFDRDKARRIVGLN